LYDATYLAPPGSTGNMTSTPKPIGSYDSLVLQFVVEAIGTTPTVTYKFQGSVDDVNWYDIGYVTDASDTISATTRSMTAVGAQVEFLSNPVARKYKWFRIVVTSNTNVTFRAEAYPV